MQPKIFGIGMSKTGTTTLGQCFLILGLSPYKSSDRRLKKIYRKTGDAQKLIKLAKKYRCFEDAPWYLAYRELDKAFPNSKFILTMRKDSLTHAKSSWAHGVRAGVRSGQPTEEYIQDKIARYQEHNNSVLSYFKKRPQDLLTICWEDGDGWSELCNFLELPIPEEPIPHANKGLCQSNQRNLGQSWLLRCAPQTVKRFLYRSKLIRQELIRRIRSSR